MSEVPAALAAELAAARPQIVPPPMQVEVLAGELVTGRRLTTLPVLASSFTVTLGAAGEITATIPLKDPDVRARKREFFGQLEPWRCFLAVQVGQQIIEAGPIVARPSYDDSTGRLEVKAQGMRAIFAKREAVNNTHPRPQESVLAYQGLSLGTIGKRIVQRTLNNPGGDLPIVLPADETGNHERNYPGYERSKVGDLLDNLTEVEGGPEFRFSPRLTTDGNGIEWVMRAGTTAQPLLSQTGDDWIFDTTTRGTVGGLNISSDAGNRINSGTVTGEGMDTATLMYRETRADEWARGYPLLEDTFSHSTASRTNTLRNHTRAYLQQGSAPWATWSLTVRRDESPLLGEYTVGDWARVHVGADHPMVPEGVHRARIAKVSGAVEDQNVKIDLMPVMEKR